MRALVLVVALSLCGCPALLPALTAAAQGAQFLGSVIDAAEGGADIYYDRHPSQDREAATAAAILRARLALQALNAALASGEATATADTERARTEALGAYRELRALLDSFGVLDAKAPPGGAETAAPEPEPLPLPTVAEVEAKL